MNRHARILRIIGLMVLLTVNGLTLKAEPKGSEFKNEEQVIEQFKALKESGKKDEALALIDDGLRQFPLNQDLLSAKFRFLHQEKRWQDCLDLLDEVIPQLTPDRQEGARSARAGVLMKLLRSEVKKQNYQQAFTTLESLADCGYRGNHQLRRSDEYAELRKHPQFSRILEKINDNAGVGKTAADFTAPLMEGGEISLKSLRGKVVLLDFWSVNCPPCVEEIPNLTKIYNTNKESGFEILSINFDKEEDRVRNFLKQNPMPWIKIFSAKGWSDPVGILYKISWIPSLWLIDRDGTLRFFDRRGEDLRNAVTALMKK
jgi:peroxiredoxin